MLKDAMRFLSLAMLGVTVYLAPEVLDWQYSAFATIMLTLWYLDLKS